MLLLFLIVIIKFKYDYIILYNMSKIISISIDVDSLKDFDAIVEASDSDRSKMLRGWIRENKQNVEE